MARVTYEFDDETESAKLRTFQNAAKLEFTLMELLRHLRDVHKYSDSEHAGFAGELIDKTTEIARSNGLVIDYIQGVT